ncbi:MAG: MotA/TolQ/ExbB proton channel family protein [Roseicyclus sp.]|jgi:chemotaxis protein MotA|uniref:motility protein A n=1 Tax=Roseicyclus amphidinii TaxID=3034232 RepID=UPI0024E04372|nr:MotA/TolQ/ExbB proton channel family protein [Roseicyclus sp. Amp-Y-6]MCT4685540.1 MotA/TolQ/ExbB proton channel family protein [Roseicyclus sp.]
MDIASLIGLIGAAGMIIGSMIYSGGVAPYIDIPSILIVIGGTFFAVMFTTPMGVFLGSFGAMAKAFMPKPRSREDLIAKMVELSDLARKNGLMALEGQELPDRFFEKGVEMLVDGADEHKLVKFLKQEISSMKERHSELHGAVRAWVDIAPAMGMIGTLIGLVQMLGAMEDPQAIGPAMAVALLTTMYGAILANVIFGPILSKLEGYSANEVVYREMVLEGLRNIARGESGRMVQEQMIASMPPKLQAKLLAAA